MTIWLTSIIKGIRIYNDLAPVMFLPLGLICLVWNGRLNGIRFLLSQLTALYLTCVFALAFLPLPTMAQAAELNTYRLQLIPFYCVYDMVKEFHPGALMGVFMNILMMIPFGMVLRYGFGLDTRKVILAGLALTLIIELGQLTGLFFLFRGSYRVCDMDDILQNTLGTVLGAQLIRRLEGRMPALAGFDMIPVARGRQVA